jgi:N-glycosylase/DNA lyase
MTMNRIEIQNKLKKITQQLRDFLPELTHDNTDGNEQSLKNILEELEEILLEMEQTNHCLTQPSINCGEL